MKSQKGITMLSLVIYVASFLAVTGVVAAITTFFFFFIKVINTDMGSSSYYNKLNLYMANETKKAGNEVYKYDTTDLSAGSKYITFKDASNNKNTFVQEGNILYYNKIALCRNVSDFKVKVDSSQGKQVVNVFVEIDGTAYSTNYVVGE